MDWRKFWAGWLAASLGLVPPSRGGTPIPAGEFRGPVAEATAEWRAQAARGVPSSSGSGLPALAVVVAALGERPAAAAALVRGLHGDGPRGSLVAAALARGYPAGVITPASAELLRDGWRGEPPPIDCESPAGYTMSAGVRAGTAARLSSRSASGLPVALDPLGVVLHELEHAKQLPYGGDPEDLYRRHGLAPLGRETLRAMELPASLGDLVLIAEAYRRHVGRPLDVPVPLAVGVAHEADWMAAQARRHGYFAGRSMTELLATPSGRAYLGRLLGGQSGYRLAHSKQSTCETIALRSAHREPEQPHPGSADR